MRGSKIEIIPAIDLKDGRCVRLYQGDYNQEIVFSDDPLDIALKWQSQGVPRLHIVDLDGAAAGEVRHFSLIRDIAHTAQIPTQVGGGVRSLETITELLKAGIDRVILSTVAVENPGLVQEACKKFGESIIVSVDARNGYIATRGWRRDTQIEAKDFVRSIVRLGVRRFIYTDITRDGTLTEPNFAAIAELVDAVRVPIIASGGVSSINHIKMLKKLGAEGVIIGKALYTGDINLKQALTAISQMDEKVRGA